MATRPLRRLVLLAVGLILTFVGLFMASLLIPADAQGLPRALGIGAIGLSSLWFGGILLGRASGRGRSPAEVRT